MTDIRAGGPDASSEQRSRYPIARVDLLLGTRGLRELGSTLDIVHRRPAHGRTAPFVESAVQLGSYPTGHRVLVRFAHGKPAERFPHVRLAFGRVRDEVLRVIGNQQKPFVYGSRSRFSN
jgi:hypothetical protein